MKVKLDQKLTSTPPSRQHNLPGVIGSGWVGLKKTSNLPLQWLKGPWMKSETGNWSDRVIRNGMTIIRTIAVLINLLIPKLLTQLLQTMKRNLKR